MTDPEPNPSPTEPDPVGPDPRPTDPQPVPNPPDGESVPEGGAPLGVAESAADVTVVHLDDSSDNDG